MCSYFPNNFSCGTVQKFGGTLVCRGTSFENPWCRGLHLITPMDTYTIGRTPLDEWSARRWDLYLTTLKRDRHPCLRRVSNPQSHHASCRRPTPYSARPSGYRLHYLWVSKLFIVATEVISYLKHMTKNYIRHIILIYCARIILRLIFKKLSERLQYATLVQSSGQFL